MGKVFSINEWIENDEIGGSNLSTEFLSFLSCKDRNTENGKKESRFKRRMFTNDENTAESSNENNTVQFYLLDSDTGKQHELKNAVQTVGASNDAEISILNDHSKGIRGVSRRHAEIWVENKRVYMKDVSMNGTFIKRNENDAFIRMEKGETTEISSGFTIRFSTKEYELVVR